MPSQSLVLNGFPVRLIDTEPLLQTIIPLLSQAQDLAIDLEFDRNSFRYGFNLCLLQIATEQACFIVDPIAIGTEALQPLWQVIENPTICKIFHSCPEDIILLKKYGCNPHNIFDTEIAAKALNYAKTSLSAIALAYCGVEMDKSLQRCNWNLRPLTAEQLHYAASDVVYLHDIKWHLVAAIEQLGRSAWLSEEFQALQTIKQDEPTDPHLRIRDAKTLVPHELHILKSVFQFREIIAQELDVPPAAVMPNEMMVVIAKNPHTNIDRWNKSRKLFNKTTNDAYCQRLAKVIKLADELSRKHKISDEMTAPVFYTNRKEAERIKVLFQPVRQRIMEQYGENASVLILSQKSINEISVTKRLKGLKNYALQIVKRTAGELGISLNEFENA